MNSPLDPAMPVFLTTAETAAFLRVSPATLAVDRCRRRWRVPFIKIGGRVVYDRNAVLRWIADRSNAPMQMEG